MSIEVIVPGFDGRRKEVMKETSPCAVSSSGFECPVGAEERISNENTDSIAVFDDDVRTVVRSPYNCKRSPGPVLFFRYGGDVAEVAGENAREVRGASGIRRK